MLVSVCLFFLCLLILLFPLVSAKGPVKGHYIQLWPCFPLPKGQFHLWVPPPLQEVVLFWGCSLGIFRTLSIVSLLTSALFIQVANLLSVLFTQSAALLFRSPVWYVFHHSKETFVFYFFHLVSAWLYCRVLHSAEFGHLFPYLCVNSSL